jgi:hypothetical protein
MTKFKQTFILTAPPHPARQLLHRALEGAPDGYAVTISEPTRTLEQNRLLWPLLTLWEKHQPLVINGEKGPASKEVWKTILLAGFRKETGERPTFALGLDGELVPLGYSTRIMGKREFADFLTFILAVTELKGMELKQRDEIDAYIKKHSKLKKAS